MSEVWSIMEYSKTPPIPNGFKQLYGAKKLSEEDSGNNNKNNALAVLATDWE